MNQAKQKLCKDKQNCPQFLAKKQCGFDHVICKFNQTCRDKQTCRFYHQAKPSFQKPKSQTQCSFGLKCNKLQSGNCPFKHSVQQKIPQQYNRKPDFQSMQRKNDNFNKNICRFDGKCYKQNCRYQHPSGKKQGQRSQKVNVFSNNNNSERTFQNNSNPIRNSSQVSNFVDMACINFLLKNQCQAMNGQCKNSHQFTSKNSIKRVFYTTQFPVDKSSSIKMFKHVQNQRGNNQANEQIYLFNQKDTIDFKKLISSQKLYENIPGLANIPQKFYLRSICKQKFKTPNIISGIDCMTLGNKQLIIFISQAKIHIYNWLTGKINLIELMDKRPQNKIISCIKVTDDIIIICTTFDQLKQIHYIQQRQQFKQDILKQLPKYKYKMFKSAKGKIFGQNIFYGITDCGKKIVFFNNHLDYKQINSLDKTFYDADIGIIKSIPICLVSSSTNPSKQQILAINLLNFDQRLTQIVLVNDSNQGFRKILIVEQHLLIQIVSCGVVVYKLGQFNKLIGVIPYSNQISQLQADEKGNALILQIAQNNSPGSLSLFKIKKI